MQALSSGARIFSPAKTPWWNSRREEEMGRIKGSGEGAGREKRKRRRKAFFSPLPLNLTSPLPFFRPRTYPKSYYFNSPQSSSVIKSKTAATTIRTWTSFRPPKTRPHCRLSEDLFGLILKRNVFIAFCFLQMMKLWSPSTTKMEKVGWDNYMNISQLVLACSFTYAEVINRFMRVISSLSITTSIKQRKIGNRY